MPSQVRSEIKSPLEVRDGTEDVEHELSAGGGGVEALVVEADQVDALCLQAVHGLEQIAPRAPESIEPGDA